MAAVDKGVRVQFTLQDGVTTVRTGTILVAIDPDPNGTDQLQKTVRSVACVDIPLLTAIGNASLSTL